MRSRELSGLIHHPAERRGIDMCAPQGTRSLPRHDTSARNHDPAAPRTVRQVDSFRTPDSETGVSPGGILTHLASGVSKARTPAPAAVRAFVLSRGSASIYQQAEPVHRLRYDPRP